MSPFYRLNLPHHFDLQSALGDPVAFSFVNDCQDDGYYIKGGLRVGATVYRGFMQSVYESRFCLGKTFDSDGKRLLSLEERLTPPHAVRCDVNFADLAVFPLRDVYC
ncbi:hypothetical protein COY07_00245 [Candidatus Peregrinibacteria bacterium CG_4_10_14_0_2_um_filter_43_11]|nr:MAG: hypothetical protein COY07_00245 [Candidatus Peregrinibacteria bacterium CG_4_10_14_0_2_um_filter_43_11]